MSKGLQLLVALVVIGMCLAAVPSYAGEVDILLQKLVEKGILTPGEAQEIKVETQEQVKREIAEGKSSSIPQWVQNTKLKGDLRLRFQDTHSKSSNNDTNERLRGRARLRLGLESKVNEKLLVGVGLATGSSDASSINKDTIRSTNQSFDNSFSKHPINLDYAFAKYMPFPWLNLVGGKMLLKDALWEPGDLMWDTDITPEGVVVDFSKKLTPVIEAFLKSGFFSLEEVNNSSDDPFMAHFQPGISLQPSDTIKARSALTVYYFGVQDQQLNGSGQSNSWYSSGDTQTPRKNILNVQPLLELNINKPFSALGIPLLDIPQLKLFGEYVKNLSETLPDDNKSGYMLGFGFGAEKVSNWGDWQAGYNFARLEKDAILDILPDSDRYEGQTNIRAHEVKFSYGLSKNTWLDIDIYRSQKLSKPKAPQTLIQVDWNMKF